MDMPLFIIDFTDNGGFFIFLFFLSFYIPILDQRRKFHAQVKDKKISKNGNWIGLIQIL